MVAELSFVILLATPCTALALSRPLLNFDFICCPGPVLALLFCASALSRPCCTCSGPEQAWLQLRCSGLVLALADHLCEDRAQHYKFDILVFYFLAYVDLDRLLP